MTRCHSVILVTLRKVKPKEESNEVSKSKTARKEVRKEASKQGSKQASKQASKGKNSIGEDKSTVGIVFSLVVHKRAVKTYSLSLNAGVV